MIPGGVVLDARTVSPRFPGIGRYVLGLVRGWGAQPPDLIASADADPRLAGRASIRVQASPFELAQQWEVRRALRARGARLYHSPFYLVPLAPGVPALVNCWDMTPLALRGLFGPGRRLAFRLAHLLAFRSARAVVVPGETVRADVLRFFPRARAKLHVVPLGADAFPPMPAGEAAARRTALGVPAAYVLYAGSNKPHKNVPVLVRAWARVLARAPAAARGLVLVAAGPTDPRFPTAALVAAREGIADRVVQFGAVDDPALQALYAGARVFVFPSRAEGFGLPVVEAMAHGVPVVCGPARALRDVAGEAAAFCDASVDSVADAVVRLLGDAAEARHLGEAGLARAARFTWSATARETERVYRRAMGEVHV